MPPSGGLYRLRRVAWALFVGVILANILVFYRDVEGVSSLRRGDFPAFYAASIILQEDSSRLYDYELQRAVENKHWPSLDGNYFAFAYPPFVAVLLSPLAWFSPLVAKGLYSVVLFLSLFGVVSILVSLLPKLAHYRLLLFVALSLFGPVLSGLSAAQNISISMLLYACAIRAFLAETGRGELLGGALMGFWLFKPQLACIGLFFLVFFGKPRVFIGAGLVAVFYYFVAVVDFGWLWPEEWVEFALGFAAQDDLLNQFQMVSLFGVLGALKEALPGGSILFSIAKYIIYVMSVVMAMLTAYRFISYKQEESLEKKRELLESALYLLGPTIVLLSPHSLYYELGLCLIPLVRYVSCESVQSRIAIISLFVLMFLLTSLRQIFPVQPMFLFALGSYWYVYRVSSEASEQ